MGLSAAGWAAVAAAGVSAVATVYSASKGAPKAPALPTAPGMGSAGVDAAAEEERRKRAGMGRASTILSGGLGESGPANSARKTLLGG